FEREKRLGMQTGWDTALLIPGASRPYIEVPAPRSEAPAAQAAALLCASLRCRGILVSGGDARDRSASDPLEHPRATFQVAHRQLVSASVIQMRVDARVPRGRPVLHLQHTLPADIRLDRLWQREVDLNWQAPPEPPQQWQQQHGFVVFRVHPQDL